MQLREFLNNNSAVVTIIAVVILVISLGIIILNNRGGRTNRIVDVYFYDLNDGSLFTAPSNSIAPIDAPSGPYNGKPGGMRAYVFACGDCDDESSRFIGWIERYTPEAKQALSGDSPDYAAYEFYETGQLIKGLEEGDPWVPANGERGYAVMERISARCPGGGVTPCYPGR